MTDSSSFLNFQQVRLREDSYDCQISSIQGCIYFMRRHVAIPVFSF